MPEPLHALAEAADVVVAPHRGELPARPAELVDERLHGFGRPRPRRLGPEHAHHEARDTLPVELRGPRARVQEHEAEHVAVARRQGAVVGQHNRGRGVPGHHVPGGRPDQGRARVQRVQHALEPRRDGFGRPVADGGRAAQPEQEDVLALHLGQHQGAADPVQHVGRGGAAAPLLQPGVPGRADVGPLRDLLAPQPRRAPARGREAQGARIEPRAPLFEVGREGRTVGQGSAPCWELYPGKLTTLAGRLVRGQGRPHPSREMNQCTCS